MMTHIEIASDFVSSDKSTIVRTKKIRLKDSSSRQASRGVPAPIRWALRSLSLVTPFGATALARRLFLKPQKFDSPTRELWWQTEARQFEIAYGSSHMAAWEWGSHGPPVLLVHGWGGRGLQMGAFAAPLVEAGYRVVAVDLPAHGQSPGRSSSLPEAAAAVSAALNAVAERAQQEVVGLVAHSFGGAATAVALAEADVKPDRLVFLGAPGDLDGVLKRFSEISGLSWEVMQLLKKSLEARFGFRWQAMQPQVLGARVNRPLLVIHDVEDDETSWLDGRQLAESWPRATMLTTVGLGHFRILRDEGVLKEVVTFLSRDSDVETLP